MAAAADTAAATKPIDSISHSLPQADWYSEARAAEGIG